MTKRFILTLVEVALIVVLASATPLRASVDAEPYLPQGLVAQGPNSATTVAIVFTGGPGSNTLSLVAMLKSLWIPATFFFSGVNAASQRRAVQTVAGTWNEIGTTTYNYRDLQSLSTPLVVSEIARGARILDKLTRHRVTWFQPPYGDVDSRITGVAQTLGLRPTMWSINSNDLTLSSGYQIARGVLDRVQRGSIILFHGQGGNLHATSSALDEIVHTLERRGFRFGTLDELFQLKPLPSCVPDPAGKFAAKGIRPAQGPIYRYWLRDLCKGVVLGPATSRLQQQANGSAMQNFATMGRQLGYSPATGRVTVTLEWAWGSAIFDAHKVKPKFGDPITHAWFSQYFKGIDEGSALTKEKKYGTVVAQQFDHGWAVEAADRTVTWAKTFSPKKPPA